MQQHSADIIIVSDVSLGYAVPQLPALARSIAGYLEGKVLLIEPDQLERPKAMLDDDEIAVQRVVTMAHPYSWSGRAEYCRAAQEIIERCKPRLLIISSYYPLPTLLNLRHKPQATYLYQIEHLGDQAFELALTQAVLNKIDLVIFPEINRARIDLGRLNAPASLKSIIMLNCTPNPAESVPAEKRNGRIFYGGTFHKQRTLAEYFLNEEVKRFPIDIFGLIQGFASEVEVTSQLVGAHNGAAFLGYIPTGPAFFKSLMRYNYSIVMWAPLDEATVNAAPNKFFDAISCGVPPICAPHPICVDIITRYRCGVLMDDWSLDGFRDRLRQAYRMIGTEEYSEMVENCLIARDAELNWDHQFARLKPYLDRLRVGRG